jgi:hypothetical protein
MDDEERIRGTFARGSGGWLMAAGYPSTPTQPGAEQEAC